MIAPSRHRALNCPFDPDWTMERIAAIAVILTVSLLATAFVVLLVSSRDRRKHDR